MKRLLVFGILLCAAISAAQSARADNKGTYRYAHGDPRLLLLMEPGVRTSFANLVIIEPAPLVEALTLPLPELDSFIPDEFDPQCIFAVMGAGGCAAAGGGTPTLSQFLGTNGVDVNRTSWVNDKQWNFDSAGPRTPTVGSTVILSGEWPNCMNTGTSACTGNGINNAPASCTTCAFTWSDNVGTNTYTSVFTPGSGCLDSTAMNHNIYFVQNLASGTNAITGAHPVLISNEMMDASNWYNMATSGGIDGSSCATSVIPANNTAPNISGNAITTTKNGDLIYYEIDDTSLQPNPITGITVPSGCSLLDDNVDNATNGAYGLAHWVVGCIQASAGSFTPHFTVAQTTHDTFVVFGAAFPAGSGGSAPSGGAGVITYQSIMYNGNSGTGPWTFNLACPANTSSIWLADDVNALTSVTDSNSNTWIGVVSGGSLGNGSGASLFHVFSPTLTGAGSTYTITLHIGTGSFSNVEFNQIFCFTGDTGHLDTFTAGSGNTQVNSSTVFNSQTSATTSGGNPNCFGTAGNAVSCTDLAEGTPSHAPDAFIAVCTDGKGPMLQSTVAGASADRPLPNATSGSLASLILIGDADDDANGDQFFHHYANSLSQINFGFYIQQNGASASCMVTALF